MSSQHIGHKKGGLFSYIGELRIPINNVPLIDYTGWTLEGRIEDKNGVVLPILTVEWVDILTGTLRARIAAVDTLPLRMGHTYRVFITPITPALEPLQPYMFTVAFQDT